MGHSTPDPTMLPSLFAVLFSGFTATALPLNDNFEIANGGEIGMLVRKEVGNPVGFFDKTFDEYKEGFSANGESWLGLERIHNLTSQKDYKLQIELTDFDGKKYVAVVQVLRRSPQELRAFCKVWYQDEISS